MEKKKFEDQEKARIKAQVGKNSHLYQGGSSLIVGARTGSITGYITLLCSCLTCTQIQADRKNIKDREMRESVSTKVVRVSSTSALNKNKLYPLTESKKTRKIWWKNNQIWGHWCGSKQGM